MSTMTVRYADPGLSPGLRDALRSLMSTDTSLGWQVPDEEISDGLAVVGRIRALVEVAEVELARQAVTRGLEQGSAWSVHDWIAQAEGRYAPVPHSGHVASVLRVAKAGITAEDVVGGTQASAAVTDVVAAFAGEDLPLGKADQLIKFEESVRRVADPQALDEDLGILLHGARDDVIATEDGPARVAGLTPKELAQAITMTARLLKPAKEQDAEDDAAKASRSLTKSAGPCGMTRYKVLLDAEGAAVLDSALAALSAPVKGPEG